MQHLTLKAQTTEIDAELGVFTALVSGWTEDREGDTILETAFDRTVEAWQRAQKRLPLLFEHSTKAVGAIFPESMHTTEEGLVVEGEVDRSTDEGRQVWRMIKNSTCSFSIGFMAESRKRKGGGREIFEIDLLEISATSTPAHAATRVVSWKSASATESPSEGDLRARSLRAAKAALAGTRRKPARYRPAPSHESADEIVERSRREHQAARAEEAEEARAAERELARKAADAEAIDRTLLLRRQHAHDPAEQSPGLGPNWQPRPSPAAIARFEHEEKKRLERIEQRRRERAAEAERRDEIERRRVEAQKPPTGWGG